MTVDESRGATPRDSSALDVLVVDDEEAVLSVVEQLTEALGHRARVADSGQAALELLEAAPYDVVISDIRMPKMDGFELAQRIRTAFPDMQIILMTGYSLDQTSQMAADLDVRAFLHKPFKASELNEALSSIPKRTG